MNFKKNKKIFLIFRNGFEIIDHEDKLLNQQEIEDKNENENQSFIQSISIESNRINENLFENILSNGTLKKQVQFFSFFLFSISINFLFID